MKYSFALLGMIMFGLIGLVFIFMFESITINNESEYYTLKEAMEASMIESVDIACFRNSTSNGCNGKLKISEQKFVENFTKRFYNNLTGDLDSYSIEFYDIMESPPKATVVIRGKKKYRAQEENKISVDGSIDASIVNNLTGILEIGKEWDGSKVIQ